MSTAGKIRSLVTRPFQSSDLAFEIPGVLDWQNSALKVGKRLAPADVISVDAMITQFAQRAGDENKSVTYSASKIQSDLNAKAAFRLRNHQEAIGLSQTIFQRDQQYSRVYKHSTQVAQIVGNATNTQLAHTRNVKSANVDRFSAVDAAYASDPDVSWQGVKKATQTVHKSKGDVVNKLYVTPVGMMTPTYKIRAFPQGAESHQELQESRNIPTWNSQNQWQELNAAAADASGAHPPAFYSQRTIISEDANERTSTNFLNEFWHPRLENKLEFERLQSVVVQEEARNAINALGVSSLEASLRRELEFIELEVLKNQVKLLNTYLLPSFPGVITAIYKDLGEHVQAGEPVLRIENDRRLYLYGFIQLRALPAIDQTVTIKSKIFEGTVEKTYSAKVVSVRGHNTDDDEWELLLELDNPPGANFLPLNYGFDPLSSSISFD
ncbi:HlyD family secretion protein [Bradyrhizobium sp. WYCCWR 12699]|uniref:HlyD family secretion protein n=1 Tax=Bradyrhizobium sp. WYCCWR 12699 TaxID=3064203 RepID=UPI0028A3C7B3|nr:HlyD family secretion protein [Bradyrhizobium sp. WYCCWR 12699]MDT4737252.1 HlyD family secretion protein [Bradyrhizobium sp. WYCCWR 12699]